ncbi:MAG: MFS transporter [Flavobacteriales bacterium]
MTNPKQFSQAWVTILVASLGYFVDIFDLQLFNIVSKKSLEGIGITDPSLLATYDYSLFLWQMSGMIIGGMIWGVMGDTKGRRSILFGSILLYSLANIANAFVTNVHQYEWIRLLAGLGLAGELGAAITLVNEMMHKEKRGYGTMVIVTMGALGAVAAAYFNEMNWSVFGLAHWQMMYLIGGGLGLMLLFLRMGTHESQIFHELKEDKSSQRGNFLMLFQKRERTLRYLACIGLGIPVWYSVGLLIKFSRDFITTNQGEIGQFNFAVAIMYTYIGLSVGDLFSALLSQLFKNRKKVILGYIIVHAAVVFTFIYATHLSAQSYYILCFLIGGSTGYWALFVTIAAETFGTNIRATVTTTVPNFVRGATIPIVLGYKALEPHLGLHNAAVSLGVISLLIAFISLFYIKESFGRDLQFTE